MEAEWAQRRPATDAERRALASVLRLRILRLCLDEALTNKELAGRLGRDPASVLHHVRTLVNQGFLDAENPRPGPRGSTEVPYRATGRSWELDFGAPGDPAQGTGIEYGLDIPADRLVSAPAAAGSSRSDVSTTRLGLQLSVRHRQEFDARMRALLDEFVARGPDDYGRRWSIVVAVQPDCSDDDLLRH